MGMSLNDFCRCTPSEFQAAWQAWHEWHENEQRGEWERLRMACILQPYSKNTLSPHDVMQFPWEEEAKKPQEEISNEELKRRYREAKRAAGLE